MKLGFNYELLNSRYSKEESYMYIKISNIIIEFYKTQSSLWSREMSYHILLYTLSGEKLIDIPISLENLDYLYQSIMYLYIHCKPFSIDIPDMHNHISYSIIGYCADDDMVIQFNFSKIDIVSSDIISYEFNLDMDYVEDFTEKYFFFYLTDLYNWDWYGNNS